VRKKEWDVSPEAKDDIEFEFSQMMKEAAITEVLIPLLRDNRVDDIQSRAAASTVHSIYNGMERVLVLLLKELRVNGILLLLLNRVIVHVLSECCIHKRLITDLLLTCLLLEVQAHILVQADGR
jgi:hypothetical protein